MQAKPKLLILSHVLPVPGQSGQQQRVFHTIRAARNRFHVTFVTAVAPGEAEKASAILRELCDEVAVLPSPGQGNGAAAVGHRIVGSLYPVLTGLKPSNYFIGRLQFPPRKLARYLAGRRFDCALFEYWHAADSAPLLRARGIPCVLDMHNVLWQSYKAQLGSHSLTPRWWKRWSLERYRRREEEAWRKFDALIAINQGEMRYVQSHVGEAQDIFYAPMGIELDHWPYCWQPAQPPRFCYYGGFGNEQNRQAALDCREKIAPRVWRVFPDAELWIVGSHPPAAIRALADGRRTRVTGHVENVRELLSTMSAVVCPWTGTYGFRSRLVEVMALGVPVVASPDAVFGMDFEIGQGLLLAGSSASFATHVRRLLGQPAFAAEQSRAARRQVEHLYNYPATYGRLADELSQWLEGRPAGRKQAS